jgi:dolichol-phosphate mannosyltransferase
MNKGIVKEGILGVLKLRWYSLFTNYRKRVKKNNNYVQSSSAEPLQNNVLIEPK